MTRPWSNVGDETTPGRTSEIHPFFSTVVVGWSNCLSSSSTPGMGIDTLNIKTYIDHIFAIWFYMFLSCFIQDLFKMTVTCLFRFSQFGVPDSQRGFGVPLREPTKAPECNQPHIQLLACLHEANIWPTMKLYRLKIYEYQVAEIQDSYLRGGCARFFSPSWGGFFPGDLHLSKGSDNSKSR